MQNKGNKRKVWSIEEKRFFLQMLTIPDKNGKPKTIAQVSEDYAVSAKTLYEWQKIYQEKGIEGFNPPRKPSDSKSKNYQLQDEIFSIAIMNPTFSAKEIINNLSKNHRRITIPTVQKILKLRNLHTLKKRLIATEYEYVKNHLSISKATLDYLFKKNPYLDLLSINSRLSATLFYLKRIDLAKYAKRKFGSILIAVDTKTLTSFSVYWDEKYLDTLIDFTNDLSTIFGGKDNSLNYFETSDTSLRGELISKRSKLQWFNSAQYYFSSDRFDIALNGFMQSLEKDFLKPYLFTTVNQFKSDLESFLFKHRISSGPPGYPAFGQSPHHITKN